MNISFTINGQPAHLDVDENTPLLWIVRDTLGLQGSKFGCGKGACSACTVLAKPFEHAELLALIESEVAARGV